MYCRYCGNEIPNDINHCVKCNNSIDSKSHSFSDFYCRHCREHIHDDSKFCPICGIKVDKETLKERDFITLRDRLKWTDGEITRYRDIEWKATSFYVGFLTILLYILVDKERRDFFIEEMLFQITLSLAIVVFVTLACIQLIFIHLSLNSRRNERTNLLQWFGEDAPPKIKGLFGFYEGRGAIFIFGFIFILLLFTGCVLLMLLS